MPEKTAWDGQRLQTTREFNWPRGVEWRRARIPLDAAKAKMLEFIFAEMAIMSVAENGRSI